MDRADIVRLIDKLDHPDAIRQREVRDQLVVLGPPVVEVLTNNLGLVNPRVRTGLVQVLGELGDPRALLPLMRYVWDQRDDHRESNPRGLAMKAIMSIARPEHAAKLFDFLVDMKDDADPFVRHYVIEAFGKLGRAEALPHVRAALEDPDEFVRERAQRTLDALEMDDEHDDALPPSELLREVRSATGARLNYFVKQVTEHEKAFEMASKLVREDGNRTLVGLQILQQLDNPAARRVAVRHYQLTRSHADRAAALRLLAEHLHADAEASEVRVIRDALDDEDKFLQLAAIAAAGRSGHPSLTQRALQATRAGDYTIAANAAEALSKVSEHLRTRIAEQLFESVRMVSGHRRHNQHEDLVRTEAYLLRAISKLESMSPAQITEAQDLALASLRRSTDLQPIVITSLELLARLTPESGYGADKRWHPADAAALVPVLRHPNPSVQRRALEVIRRGAPGDAPNLTREFEQLMRSDDIDLVSDSVIPAILETDGPRAQKQLARLAVADEPRVRRAAEAALRRARSRRPHIDVEFRRASE